MIACLCRSPRLFIVIAAGAICWMGIMVAAGRAQEPTPAGETVAAHVNGEAIYVNEVRHELSRVIKDRPIEPQTRRLMQAKTLAQLIDRRLIIQWLQKSDRAASQAEIDLAVTRLEKRLKQREVTLEQHLDKLKLTELQLRRLFEWQASWQRFLDRYFTDQNLEQFFRNHQRDYDGTQLRVAHILLKVDGDGTQSTNVTVERAARLRQQIKSGALSFEAAAKRESAAPTAAKGGDIGFISRREPMPEAFSRAAFGLEDGDVSEPVITAFGVHLIRCLEIEPGKKRWQDVREELTGGVTQYLFTWAADRERPRAKIEFTGVMPHFQPGTKTLAD